MIVLPQITVFNIHLYYVKNMIHAIDIWMFILFILYAFIECKNKSDIGMGAFIWVCLYYKEPKVLKIKNS